MSVWPLDSSDFQDVTDRMIKFGKVVVGREERLGVTFDIHRLFRKNGYIQKKVSRSLTFEKEARLIPAAVGSLMVMCRSDIVTRSFNLAMSEIEAELGVPVQFSLEPGYVVIDESCPHRLDDVSLDDMEDAIVKAFHEFMIRLNQNIETNLMGECSLVGENVTALFHFKLDNTVALECKGVSNVGIDRLVALRKRLEDNYRNWFEFGDPVMENIMKDIAAAGRILDAESVLDELPVG